MRSHIRCLEHAHRACQVPYCKSRSVTVKINAAAGECEDTLLEDNTRSCFLIWRKWTFALHIVKLYGFAKMQQEALLIRACHEGHVIVLRLESVSLDQSELKSPVEDWLTVALSKELFRGNRKLLRDAMR